MELMPYMDVVLLGIHPNTREGLSKKEYTDILIRAMEKNPYIDIITHPNDFVYQLEFKSLARAAAGLGIVFELNNSRTLYNRTTFEITEAMLQACIKEKCSIALCSDAHVIHEIGLDDSIQPVLKKMNFPEELIVNSNAEKGFAFIEKRREIKRKFY